MKSVARSIALGALALAFTGGDAVAQLAGMPVDLTTGNAGITIAGQYGRGLNDNSGKTNSAQGMISFGGPMFTAGAGAGYADFSGLKAFNFGGKAAVNLPLTGPLGISAGAGVGYWSKDGFNQLNIPAGVTIMFSPPSTGIAVKPFVTPYFRYVKGKDVDALNGFGGVAGVKIDMMSGLGFDLLFDYAFSTELGKGMLLGAGLHYTLGG